MVIIVRISFAIHDIVEYVEIESKPAKLYFVGCIASGALEKIYLQLG